MIRDVSLDGKTLLLAETGDATGAEYATYLLDIVSGSLEPVTDEGNRTWLPTPDGRFFAELSQEGPSLVALEGDETWDVQGVEPDDFPIRWASDNRSIYVWKRNSEYPVHIYRLDTKTGERQIVAQFEPSDRAGTGLPTSLSINPDGTAWAFSYPRIFSELHLVEGLR